MAEFKLSLSEVSALFKIKYEKLSENVYNSANVLLGRVKKSYNFTGKELAIAIPQSFSGGVGSGDLPSANTAIYGDARIQAKKMYAVVEIDRETIKASLSDEGAFVRATKEVVQKGVESFMRNLSRALFNDGTGSLGVVASEVEIDAAGIEAGAPGVGTLVNTKVTITDMKEANFEERDLVNVATASLTGALRTFSGSDKIEIQSVNPDDNTIVLPGTSLGITAADVIIMQGSRNNDPEGLKLLDKVEGESSYGIAHGRRWKAAQKTSA